MLLAVLVGAAVNYLLGYGVVGVVIAIIVAVTTSFLAYWKSDSVALRMSRAVPADPVEIRPLVDPNSTSITSGHTVVADDD